MIAEEEELLSKAKSLNRAEKHEEVIALLTDKVLTGYNNQELYRQKTIAFFGLGFDYDVKKEYDKAIECFNKALELTPNYSRAHNGLAIVYDDLKQYDLALKHYLMAIKLNPKDPMPCYNIGITYDNLKQYGKGITFYNKAIKIDPKYTDAYYNRAADYYILDKYKESRNDYSKYLEYTENATDYYALKAKSRIVELNKLISSADYSALSELVTQIKKLLSFQDQCVTHYTSLSVTKALILEDSEFRLSEGAYLNDTSAGRELYNFLPSFVATYNKENDTVAVPFVVKPFIGSFVAETKHDDLTLWRMYGKENKEEAKGCAITIYREKLLENIKASLLPGGKVVSSDKTIEEFSFYKVAYRKQGKNDYFSIPGATQNEEDVFNSYMATLKNEVGKYLKKKKKDNVNDIQNLIELINDIAYLFKSAEYHYEHELRLVVKGGGISKEVDTIFDPPRVYLKMVGINPLIKKITLGPKVEKSEEWASAFYYTLDKQDYHPEILISHLPFK